MKKLLLVFPIVALLAAGCHSSQQTSSQTPAQPQVTQNTNPAPTPIPTSTADSSQTPPQTTEFKTVTNDVLHFSVSIPTDYNLVGGGSSEPVYNVYSINNAADNGMQGTINIQMQAGWTNDLAKDLPNYFASPSDFNPTYVKPFQSATGLTGIIYVDPKKFIEEVLILYPGNLQSKVQPTHLPKIADPLRSIEMAGYEPFTAAQDQLFTEVINSLKFSN